jgi:hypothetical protein
VPQTLILLSHAFQLLLDFPFLLVQLVLSLLLRLQLLFQPLLSLERLLITAALGQCGALQSSAGICLFGANRSGKDTKTKQQASRFHRYSAPFYPNHGNARPLPGIGVLLHRRHS